MQRPTTTATSRRYPLAPLIKAAGVQLGPRGGDQAGEHRQFTLLAERLGISRQKWWHLNRTGLTDRQADRYAIRLGQHPALIWNDWNDIDPDIEEDDHGVMTDRTTDLDHDGDLRDLAF